MNTIIVSDKVKVNRTQVGVYTITDTGNDIIESSSILEMTSHNTRYVFPANLAKQKQALWRLNHFFQLSPELVNIKTFELYLKDSQFWQDGEFDIT